MVTNSDSPIAPESHQPGAQEGGISTSPQGQAGVQKPVSDLPPFPPSVPSPATFHQGSPFHHNPFSRPVAPTTPEKDSLGEMTVEQGFFQKKSRAFGKLGLFLVVILLFGSTTTVLVTQFFTQKVRLIKKGVLFSAGLKETVWQSFGTVSEAELELSIQGDKGGVLEYPFLLDTGAVVSSLPREMAERMGYNLAFLPRQTFKGFGNTTSFAYQAEMTVNFGEKQIKLPVVFTEASGSKALLGRKGLFDKFSIVIDHKNKVVEIRE